MCAASASARTHSNHKAKHSGTQIYNLQDPTGQPVKDPTAMFGLCSSKKTHIMTDVVKGTMKNPPALLSGPSLSAQCFVEQHSCIEREREDPKKKIN